MYGQHNVRAITGGNTGRNTENGHKPSLMTEIKISDPAGKESRAARFKRRDSSDHATTQIIFTLAITNSILAYHNHKKLFLAGANGRLC